jgi:hypothetical protein
VIESYIERWDLAKEGYRVSVLRDGDTLEWCETTSDGCTTGRGITLEHVDPMRIAVFGLISSLIGEGYELGGHEVYDPGQLLAYLTELEKRPASEQQSGGAFWADLKRDLRDPAFAAAYEQATQEIRAVDAAHSDTAAEAGPQQTPAERLEQLLRTDRVVIDPDVDSDIRAVLALYDNARERAAELLRSSNGYEAERDQLRRRLDAAEAQSTAEVWLCEKDGTEPHPWATLEAAQADALTSWEDAPYTMRWRMEGADGNYWRLYADDTWTHSAVWREPILGIPGHDEPNPLDAAVTEALADIANDDHADPDPEPAPADPPWLIPAGDD